MNFFTQLQPLELNLSKKKLFQASNGGSHPTKGKPFDSDTEADYFNKMSAKFGTKNNQVLILFITLFITLTTDFFFGVGGVDCDVHYSERQVSERYALKSN